MRRFMILTATMLIALLVATSAMAQVRGRGRLQGTVTDKESGKAIEGATVTVVLASESTQPIVVKTDSRGHWSALGLTTGQWNVDISSPGYTTSRGTANVSEITPMPTIQTGLAHEVKREAVAPAPTPLVPKEAIEAIKEGQALMGEQKYKEALVDFEKALPMVPTDKPELKTVHDQIMQVMAQAYYKTGDLKNAIAMLEKSLAEDPSNTPSAVLLANLYLEDGRLEAGKALLEKLPPSAITDPTAYINVGILFLNKKNPADGITYFTKAIDMNPKLAEGYYYRGLARAQLKKTLDSRADFEQVIALSPGSQEAKDAKVMLDGMPKK
jgi:predicted Zn-dependent protease